MSKVIQLPGAPTLSTEPVQSIVQMLERLLALAKDGDIRAIAVAFVDKNRDASIDWENEENFFALMGAVSYLGHSMYRDAR